MSWIRNTDLTYVIEGSVIGLQKIGINNKNTNTNEEGRMSSANLPGWMLRALSHHIHGHAERG
jgi:hypothetical protein